MSAKDIPDDVKVMLRSVLIAHTGVKQGNLSREYKDTVGDHLTYCKWGFKNIYDFLQALEGDITRLEFSEILEDNVVYAVVDKTSYTSKHAEKNATKYGTGIPSKSPDEIAEWLKEKRGGAKPRSDLSKKQSNKILASLQQRKPVAINKTVKQRKELLPTSQEWDLLRNIKPDNVGLYTLGIKNVGVRKNLALNVTEILKVFDKYMPERNVQFYKDNTNKRCAFIKFPYLLNTYRAWKDKTNTVVAGQRIQAIPLDHGTYNQSQQLSSLIVLQLPVGVLMSTVVVAFSKYKGLVQIDPHQQQRSATVYYSQISSVLKAKEEITSLKVGSVDHPVVIMVSGSNVPATNDFSQGILANPPSKDTITKTNAAASSTPVQPAPQPNEVNADAPVEAAPQPNEVNPDAFTHLACGFCLDYSKAYEMFQAVCRRSPRTARNVASEITPLVTFPVDSCRFWMVVVDIKNNNSFQKLTEMEKKLAEDCEKIQIQNVLPKPGLRGAAKYAGVWYRCWVLSSCMKTDTVTVYYCDYGNNETVPRTNFRSTYPEIWKLPPLAVPCKLHGYENRYAPDSDEYVNGTSRLMELLLSKPLKADVVKDAIYSQPHIVEVRNVYDTSNPEKRIEDIMKEEGFIKEIGSDDAEAENVVDGIPMSKLSINAEESESLFDYDEDELVVGMISEVHNLNLIYLHLGSFEGFTQLQTLMEQFKDSTRCELVKGALVLMKKSDERRRVLILDVCGMQAKVLHADFGVIENVSVTYLFKLSQELHDYPFQSRPAVLAGLRFPRDSNINRDVVRLLKSKIKQPMKFSIIKESDSGKVSVEIFEMQKEKSLNQELVEMNLAKLHMTDVDEKLSDEDEAVRLSVLSLSAAPPLSPQPLTEVYSNHGKPLIPLQAVRCASVTSNSSSYSASNPVYRNETVNKTKHVESWIQNSVESHAGESGRPDTPPYPPPDIITSNCLPNDKSVYINENVRIHKNKVILSADEYTEDVDEVRLDKNNCVVTDDVIALRQKWQEELRKLRVMKEYLSRLSDLDSAELNQVFKEKKKEKLELRIRLKALEKKRDQLKRNYEHVQKELENILEMI